ncbi:MAG: DUF2189 domain-containing protein [Rhodospirillales bacterium]
MADNGARATHGNAFPYADRVNGVTVSDTLRWLGAGWRDFRRSGAVSLAYGLIFVVAGLVLTVGLYLADLAHLIVPLTAGFLLVGPALTVGFYAISRDIEQGRTAQLTTAITAWRANPIHLLALGLALVLFLIVWVRLAVLIFALTFPYTTASLEAMAEAALFTVEGLTFLGIGTVVGGIMATLAFVTSVFSLPIMLDRKVDIIQAVTTSVVAVAMNARVMAVWAALIVAFTVVGLATFYVGLAITLPLIGHASWHAYRAVIRQPA